MTMRVADYIWKTLADWGVRHVFLVTGGGAMHLNDALGRETRIKYVCNLHEQACAMAAEGYARSTANRVPGVVSVTTGPGGTNALTGVMGAWLDSVPMIVISGQIKRATMITAAPELHLRQLGDQEYNIVDAVKPMTKMAKTVMSVEEVPQVLAEAWRLCQTGRPGPVWIDVPLDIQASPMDLEKVGGESRSTEDGLISNSLNSLNSLLTPTTPSIPSNLSNISNLNSCNPCNSWLNKFLTLLHSAKRPALICGSGIHNAHCETELLAFAERFQIPVLTSISGIDLIPSDHPLFFGRPGILGERPANLIMQNSDLFLVLGTRMGIRICGYAYETIAREATKVMVDIDPNELNKPTFRPDVKIESDVGDFLRTVLKETTDLANSANLDAAQQNPQNNSLNLFNSLLNTSPSTSTTTSQTSQTSHHADWLSYCRRVKARYPVILPGHRARTDYVSSYVLPEKLMEYAPAPVTLVTSNGIAYTSTFQAIPIKKGMRMFSNEACASMGYGLPAAIGAWFGMQTTNLANSANLNAAQQPPESLNSFNSFNSWLNSSLICLEGDGSIQMNLQELQTLITYQIPMKLFVYNNGGYLSIKTTQRAFFGGKFMGSESSSGVVLPSFEKLAAAYGLAYFKLLNNQELDAKLPQIFATPGPVLIEVMLDPFEVLGPKAASKKLPDGSMVSAPLEDMAPFLPRDEFRENMIVKPLEEAF